MQLDMYECIKNERNALRMLDHNFILKQVKTLKDSENIFFLNEYIRGKTLNKIIKDLGNLNKYISAIPELQSYATELYWVAINTTIDSKTRVKCRSIENFNNTLKLYFPYVTWIDTYTYLLADGFNSADGLHYDSATYNKLYYYIMSYVINAEFAKDFPTVPNASQTEF